MNHEDTVASHPAPGSIIRYYSRDNIRVTSHWLYAGDGRYRLADIDNVVRVREPVHPGVKVGILIAIADATLVALLAALTGEPVILGIGLVTLLLPCLMVGDCAGRQRPGLELWADYYGSPRCLFRTTNEREF